MSWFSKLFGGSSPRDVDASTNSSGPENFWIFPDEFHLPHVGRAGDGRQVFLTQPFVPAIGEDAGGEYIALYSFDADGRLADYSIKSLGPRCDLDEEEAGRLHREFLDSISPLKPQGILVRPFAIEHEGVKFGLIPHEYDDEDGDWTVEVHPGNYIAFIPPWDEGGYDT